MNYQIPIMLVTLMGKFITAPSIMTILIKMQLKKYDPVREPIREVKVVAEMKWVAVTKYFNPCKH
jgi:hypothetical protein